MLAAFARSHRHAIPPAASCRRSKLGAGMKPANLPLATARFRWFNRQRELKAKTKKHNKQFAASAAV
jgi:hypothetical protein